jgi:uncharacterized OB-fold protein
MTIRKMTTWWRCAHRERTDVPVTVLESAPAPYLKPLPAVSEASRPFFDALRRREFVVPRCDDCGDYSWIPHPACRSCQSENIRWSPVSGRATVYSYTIVYRAPGAFTADVPYVIVLAELEEQPRPCLVLGNLVGIDVADVRIGMPVEIAYEDIPGEDLTLWRWVPTAAKDLIDG